MKDSEVVGILLGLLKTIGDAEDPFLIWAARAKTTEVKEALERAATGLEATITWLGRRDMLDAKQRQPIRTGPGSMFYCLVKSRMSGVNGRWSRAA